MQFATTQKHKVVTYAVNTPNTDIRSVVVVGVGYVGLPLALRAAQKNYRVIGFDIDHARVARLQKREANYITEHEQNLFKSLSKF